MWYSKEEIERAPEKYILPAEDVSAYKKSTKLEKAAEIIGGILALIMFLFILFTIFMIIGNIINFLGKYIEIHPFIERNIRPREWETVIGGFALSFILLMLFVPVIWISERFNENARETGVSGPKLALHYIGMGVQYYENEDYKKAVDILSEIITSEAELPHISEKAINAYLEEAKTNDKFYEEFVQNSYLDFISIIILNIDLSNDFITRMYSSVLDTDSTDYISKEIMEDVTEAEVEGVSYIDVIRESIIKPTLPEVNIGFWTLYIFAASIGIGTFFSVGETAGIISLTILLTGIQIYDRRRER
jgi:hypothetical protein